MRTLIIVATTALALTSTASFAGGYMAITEMPTFYEEFTNASAKKTEKVTKADTKAAKIIVTKEVTTTKQDADN